MVLLYDFSHNRSSLLCQVQAGNLMHVRSTPWHVHFHYSRHLTRRRCFTPSRRGNYWYLTSSTSGPSLERPAAPGCEWGAEPTGVRQWINDTWEVRWPVGAPAPQRSDTHRQLHVFVYLLKKRRKLRELGAPLSSTVKLMSGGRKRLRRPGPGWRMAAEQELSRGGQERGGRGATAHALCGNDAFTDYRKYWSWEE